MASKAQGKAPAVKPVKAVVVKTKASATPSVAKPIEVRSLETRLADVTDRSEMLAGKVAALELVVRKLLEHWPQGRGKLRKDLQARSKRVGKAIDKNVPAVDRPSWQKAIDDLIASID